MAKVPPTVIFCTTNQGKLDFLSILLQPSLQAGRLELRQHAELELPELQANSVHDVALHKARFAFKALGQPVLVQDSGFVIEALHGFPGPYTKYCLATIGVQGLLKLAEGAQSRKCGFDSCVVFVDRHGGEHVFCEEHAYFGELAEEPVLSSDEGRSIGETWGKDGSADLFSVFRPTDVAEACCPTLVGLTLGEMTKEQLTVYRQKRHSAFASFARWACSEAGAAILALE
eukprot:TRINITY_DN47176_c0_g1_i1.p1 TRINITY_DN47176_c0_g1~~TRINITY_DN47176_c0_g1_i1.p1  ORF type:complete len:230 (+),score=50.96 TRINITY_DN47176_c0_g1_i1:96-785(+)